MQNDLPNRIFEMQNANNEIMKDVNTFVEPRDNPPDRSLTRKHKPKTLNHACAQTIARY